MSAIAQDLKSRARTPEVARSEPNRWLILALVSVADFMVILDLTIVNIALPSIQRALSFSATDLQWVINIYTLFFGSFLLLGGRAGDIFGRQRLFVAGMALFTGASVLNGAADSQAVLVAGRALQGFGAALVQPATLAIIIATFTDTRERARAIGVWSIIASSGASVGLLAGGILTETLSWRWVFFVNLPVGAIAVLLAVRYLPNSMAEKRPHGIDIAGALAVVAGFLFLIFAIVRAQEWGWGSPRIIGLLVASVATFGAFAVIELSSRAPLIRLAIFRRRPIVASLGAMLALTSAAMGMFFFLSLYFQDVLGYSPLRSGVGFLPLSLAIGVAAFSSQRMLERVNARTILLAGLAILAAGLAIFTQLPSDAAYATRILPPMLISAAGLGLCFPPVIMIATNTVDADDAGLASGLINSAQQIGFALGLAVLATIAADRTTSVLGAHAAGGEAATARALVDGYHLAWAVAASVAVAGFVLVATLIRNRDLSMSAQMTPADPEAGGVPEFAFDTEEIA